MILLREIRSWSVLGVKGVKSYSSYSKYNERQILYIGQGLIPAVKNCLQRIVYYVFTPLTCNFSLEYPYLIQQTVNENTQTYQVEVPIDLVPDSRKKFIRKCGAAKGEKLQPFWSPWQVNIYLATKMLAKVTNWWQTNKKTKKRKKRQPKIFKWWPFCIWRLPEGNSLEKWALRSVSHH